LHCTFVGLTLSVRISLSLSCCYFKLWIYTLLDIQITTGKNDKGLKLYDPGYLNTAPVRSSICYIDGDEGILRYRGYPIEELAESSTFLEVAYLLSKFSVEFSKNVLVTNNSHGCHMYISSLEPLLITFLIKGSLVKAIYATSIGKETPDCMAEYIGDS
jgi:hypothetical protein